MSNTVIQTETQVKTKKGSLIPRAPMLSWVALLFLWLIFAMNATGREIMNRVMPLIVNEYNIPASATGGIVALVMVSTSFIAIWAGSWSDRKGQGWARKKSNIWLALGYTLFCVLIGLTALTSVVGGFIILQVLKSAFSGAGESVEVTSVAEWWPQESRGFALGAHHTGYPWGSLISGLVISAILVASGNDWRLPFLFVPLAIIPIFIAYWIFATPERFKKYEKRALEMGLTPTISTEETKVAEKGSVKENLKNPNILVGTIVSLLSIAGYVGIGFWIAPYLAFASDFSFASAAAWSVVFTITGGIGQIVWGSISDTIGRKPSLLLCFAMLAISFFMLPLISKGLAWLICIQLFMGLFTNAVYPVLYALVGDSAKKGSVGTALGIQMTGLYIGGISPLVLGIFISLGGGWETATGYVYGAYFLASLMILAFILVLLFTRETVGKKRGKDWSLVSLKSCGIEES